MTDREKAGQPPRFSWGEALRQRMFAVRFQVATVTLSGVLAAFTISAPLVLSKAFCLNEATTIAPRGVWVGLALLAAMVLPLKT